MSWLAISLVHSCKLKSIAMCLKILGREGEQIASAKIDMAALADLVCIRLQYMRQPGSDSAFDCGL
jgi:hypothetical protein